MAIRVVMADDHPTILAGLEQLLRGLEDIEIVGQALDSTGLIDVLNVSRCDVVFTDFSMPGERFGDGIQLLRFIQRRFPEVRLVVLTGIENRGVLQTMLDIGVTVVVSKSDHYDLFETAIRKAHAREKFLSPTIEQILSSDMGDEGVDGETVRLTKREVEVLRLLAEGLSLKEVGERVRRSPKTISGQKLSAMKKLGLSSDAELFSYAMAHGLVQASQSAQAFHGTGALAKKEQP